MRSHIANSQDHTAVCLRMRTRVYARVCACLCVLQFVCVLLGTEPKRVGKRGQCTNISISLKTHHAVQGQSWSRTEIRLSGM